jgi:hypothetical protein
MIGLLGFRTQGCALPDRTVPRAAGLLQAAEGACNGGARARDKSSSPENDFTNRNLTFMTWNLMHLARVLKDAGGIPAHGNQRSAWEAGCRFGFENPDYR